MIYLKLELIVKALPNLFADNLKMAVSIELARKDTFVSALVALPLESTYDFSSLWLVTHC